MVSGLSMVPAREPGKRGVAWSRQVLVVAGVVVVVDAVSLGLLGGVARHVPFVSRLDDVLLASLCAMTGVAICPSSWARALLSGGAGAYGLAKLVAACVAGSTTIPTPQWVAAGTVAVLCAGECCLLARDAAHKRAVSTDADYELMGEEEEEKDTLSWRDVFRLLRPYMWPNAAAGRVAVVSTVFLVLASKACNVVAPLALGVAANAFSNGRRGKAAVYASIYASLSFASKTLKEGQSLAYLRVQRVAFGELARHTFAHLHGLSLEWYLSKKMGEVVRVVDRGTSGADTMMRYGVLYLAPSLGEALAVCAIFIAKFDLWQLSVLVAGSVAAYSVATVALTLWRAKFRAQMNVSDNRWHTRLTDSLVNFETVKYFTAETYELGRFGATVDKYQANSVSVQASLSLLNVVQQIILNGCLAGALALAAFKGHSVGTFVAVSSYVAQLFAPLSFLGTVYNALVTAVVDLRNLSQLLHQKPLVSDAPDAIAHPNASYGASHGLAVAFKRVSFKYPNRRAAFGLRDLSFDVPAGASLGVCGSTGAGKSTVARLVFRFFDVDEGAVLIGGVDVRKCAQASLRALLGVVPQDCVLFNDTIAYNIAYGSPLCRGVEDDPRVADAARKAELSKLVDSLDDGLKTLVGERGLQLSGGEKQRVAIARLILKNPPIAVFDEATSALDSKTERAIQSSLNEIAKSRTTVTIAHRLGTLKTCDQILVLEQGRLAHIGTHADLLAQPDSLYARMWNAQLADEEVAPESPTQSGDSA